MDDVPNDEDSDGEAEAPKHGDIEASIGAIHARYIKTKPNGMLAKEGIRQVPQALHMEYTERAKRRLLNTQSKRFQVSSQEPPHGGILYPL